MARLSGFHFHCRTGCCLWYDIFYPQELSWDEAKRKVLEEAYDDELKNYKECKSELEKRQAKRRYFKSVKATIDHLGDAVTEFDERLWCNLLDHIVVNDEERVTVIFRDGMEIVVPLGNLVKSRTRTASREKNDLVKRAVARF